MSDSNGRDPALSHVRGLTPTGRLRKHILANHQAGDILNEKRLMTQVGLTRRELRAALADLKGEELVVIHPRIVTQVRPLSQREINSWIAIRRALDVMATTTLARIVHDSSVKNSLLKHILECDDWMNKITKEIGERGINDDDRDAFLEADEEFHAAICRAAEYDECVPILAKSRRILRLLARPPLQNEEDFLAVIREHRAILDTIRAKEPFDEAIRRAVEEHIRGLIGRWFPAAPVPPESARKGDNRRGASNKDKKAFQKNKHSRA